MVQNAEIYYIAPANINRPSSTNERQLFIDQTTAELKVKLSDNTTSTFSIAEGGNLIVNAAV